MNNLNPQVFGFHERHLLPRTLELCVVRHMKVSMKQKVRTHFMFAFLSAGKRLTFTSTFDYFCLQIAILLSYKVPVILKVFPSHCRGWSEGEYM